MSITTPCVHPDISAFHTLISQWILDIHADIRSDGYIVDNPKSLCGKKVRELRNHCMTKSAEISAIRIQTRRTHTNCMHMLRRSIYFLLENLFPLFISTGSFGLLYWFWTRRAHEETEKTYVQQGGEFFGFILHSFVSFGSSLIDSTTGTDMFFMKLQAFLIASAIAVMLYVGTAPFTSIIIYARMASTKQEEIRILQNEFRIEYMNLIEQALYKHVIANLLEVFEYMLYITSPSASEDMTQRAMQIVNTYYPNYDVFYMYIISQLENAVREMNIITLIRSVNVSPQFIHVLFQLIRHSEDIYARDLMAFNQALIDSPMKAKGAIISLSGLGV
jgi:hypothetical protein